MRTQMLRLKFIPLLLLLVATGIAQTGQNPYGQLRGKVIDAATGDPIVGASIQVIGQKIGTITDFHGEFSISRMSAERCSLIVSFLQYASYQSPAIDLRAGKVPELIIKLSRRMRGVDEKVTVIGKKDIVDKFEAGNQSKVSNVDIAKQPVTTMDELRTQVAEAQKKGITSSPRRENGADGKSQGSANQSSGQGYVAPDQYLTQVMPLQPRKRDGWTHNDEPDYGHPYYPEVESQFHDMFFRQYGVNPFVETRQDNQSTFAMDVDDASYTLTRSYLERGELPPADAVRVEEFVNHFDYAYPPARRDAFSLHVEGSSAPYGDPHTRLLRLGLRGEVIQRSERQPVNLILCIDVSGSMNAGDRLEMVKRSLRHLMSELKPHDRVGIVTFSTRGKIILQPTSVSRQFAIRDAITSLRAGGSTNAEEGLRLSYEMASRIFDRTRMNRIVLCSDGVANVGNTTAESILDEVTAHARKGILLSTVGVGMGNYNDELLEQLGNRGNGHYSYIDTDDEARAVFRQNAVGELQVIARDAKIQVTFDPAVVRSYRLIGYENRDMADEDFRNRRVDGGEVGSGHMVTALYEIKLHRRVSRTAELGQVNVRFQDPQSGKSREYEDVIPFATIRGDFDDTSDQFQLAAMAAEFAEILRGSYFARNASLIELADDVAALAENSGDPQIEELRALIELAAQIESPYAYR